MRGLTSEEDLANAEARMNRTVWAGRAIGVVLTGAVLLFLLLTAAERPWQYLVYPLLVGLLLGYAIVVARYIRVMHVEVLRRYQAQLVLRTAELQEMASRDELTGLYNRRHFYEAIQTELERARTSREPLALVVLDVDGLKGINDEYGHQVGDVIIANFARVIAKHTRNRDVPARLGGDEFG
ncbi:MAG TPA: GGDEF domain-containing protein, partial [Dehalococcoidia bacterium]|nr:GGDEF domain-containing protein [Dehalococcoidia bacterium]